MNFMPFGQLKSFFKILIEVQYYSVAALTFVGLKEYPCFFMQWK